MIIEITSIEEFKPLWSGSKTKEYFLKGIADGRITFLAVKDDNKNIIGELYVFWDSEDKEEANGIDRAYLSAFRIEKEYRGMGLGKKLMMKAFETIEEKGFREITIGVDESDAERLKDMYRHFGFAELVKLQHYDYHYIGQDGSPVYYEKPYKLYLKR